MSPSSLSPSPSLSSCCCCCCCCSCVIFTPLIHPMSSCSQQRRGVLGCPGMLASSVPSSSYSMQAGAHSGSGGCCPMVPVVWHPVRVCPCSASAVASLIRCGSRSCCGVVPCRTVIVRCPVLLLCPSLLSHSLLTPRAGAHGSRGGWAISVPSGCCLIVIIV